MEPVGSSTQARWDSVIIYRLLEVECYVPIQHVSYAPCQQADRANQPGKVYSYHLFIEGKLANLIKDIRSAKDNLWNALGPL